VQPLTRRKLRCALSIPAAHQRLTMVPSRHRFTLRAVLRVGARNSVTPLTCEFARRDPFGKWACRHSR
jgi:hypothetical protein